MIKLLQGDCLERMKEIADGSVDMVLTDPPYGTTACKWDSIIPLDLMWWELKRIIKPNGAIVLTASQPFTTTLISSNMKMFKYCWYWKKNMVTGVSLAKTQPMRCVEDVVIFYSMPPVFNKELVKSQIKDRVVKDGRPNGSGSNGGEHIKMSQRTQTQRPMVNPRNLLDIKCVSNSGVHKLHPTQKPIKLMEYLIRTYTNEGETVLDFTMGSGTTGVACKNLNRRFIGIEKDEKYFEIAKQRIETT